MKGLKIGDTVRIGIAAVIFILVLKFAAKKLPVPGLKTVADAV